MIANANLPKREPTRLEPSDRAPLRGPVSVVRSSNQGGGRKKKPSGKRVPEPLRTVMVACSNFPPNYQATPTLRCKRRWTSVENVAVTGFLFLLSSGHRCFSIVTTASTTAMPYVDCWRIRRISVWTINSDENATTAVLTPLGLDIDSNSFNDRQQAFSCSSRSDATPGKMSIKPAPDTPLGAWHLTSTVNSAGTLFSLEIDYGGASSGNWASVTLDIDFEYVLNDIGAPRGYTVATTSPTLGLMGGYDLFVGGSACFSLQGINNIG